MGFHKRMRVRVRANLSRLTPIIPPSMQDSVAGNAVVVYTTNRKPQALTRPRTKAERGVHVATAWRTAVPAHNKQRQYASQKAARVARKAGKLYAFHIPEYVPSKSRVKAKAIRALADDILALL